MKHSPILESRQLYGSSYKNKSYQQNSTSIQIYEVDEFNLIQNNMYKKLVHGLRAFSEKQIEQLSPQSKTDIIKKHQQTQAILNRWKQTIVSELADNFFLNLFPHSSFVKKMVEYTKNYNTNTLTCRASFQDLGLTKVEVASKLIEAELLPSNFFSIG